MQNKDFNPIIYEYTLNRKTAGILGQIQNLSTFLIVNKHAYPLSFVSVVIFLGQRRGTIF